MLDELIKKLDEVDVELRSLIKNRAYSTHDTVKQNLLVDSREDIQKAITLLTKYESMN